MAIDSFRAGQGNVTAIRFEAQFETESELHVDLHATACSVPHVVVRGAIGEIVGHETDECGLHCRLFGIPDRQGYRSHSELGK